MGCDEVILLDTHVVVWVTTGSRSLGKECRELYEKTMNAGEVAISAVSFWEMAMLIDKNLLGSLKEPNQLRTRILETGVRELPLTGDIAILAGSLDMHGDPADRFIVATAMTHGATLVTADKALLKWRGKLPRQNAEK
jgi:PIN domain nuclease of toxin-antitoxin system